jgi:A/G-specific adenine glycosylase
MKQPPPGSAIRYFRTATLRWYLRAGRSFAWRRASAPLYHQIVVEVLLQRTRAETVQAFFPDFLAEYPSWRSLAGSSPSAIGRIVRPIGLWERRGRALHALGMEMARRRGRFPAGREDIEALPAVGQYVANAIELFAFGRPRPLLDAGMARVLERYFGPRRLADIRDDPYLQALAARVARCAKPKEINWAVLDVAATLCRPSNPDCAACPLHRRCRSAR